MRNEPTAALRNGPDVSDNDVGEILEQVLSKRFQRRLNLRIAWHPVGRGFKQDPGFRRTSHL